MKVKSGLWENYYHLVNPCFIILLLLHGKPIRQAREHLALQVESGEKGQKKRNKRGQQRDLLMSSSLLIGACGT